MGKVKKIKVGEENFSKEKSIKRNSVLSTLEKSKTPKSRRKTLGSIPTFEKNPKEFSISIENFTENVLVKKPKKENSNFTKELTEFGLDRNNIEAGIKALFKVEEKKKSESKELFEEASPIFLQVICVKIPRCPVRTLRLALKHSLLADSNEICLIASDVPGISKKEIEKVQEHYENLLQEKDVSNIKTIMPFYQLKTEYDQFELKRKLVELYDVFLVEAKISGYVNHNLGKIFRNKRKTPIPVKLHVPKLKKQIESAMMKTSLNIHPHGDNFIVQIAHTGMAEGQVFDNFVTICTELKKSFPGSWQNIRGLNIKTSSSMSIPVYLTLKHLSTVRVPVVKPKRSKAFKPVEGELSTQLSRDVTVLPSGVIRLHDNRHSGNRSVKSSETIGKDKKNEKEETAKVTAVQMNNNSEKKEKDNSVEKHRKQFKRRSPRKKKSIDSKQSRVTKGGVIKKRKLIEVSATEKKVKRKRKARKEA